MLSIGGCILFMLCSVMNFRFVCLRFQCWFFVPFSPFQDKTFSGVCPLFLSHSFRSLLLLGWSEGSFETHLLRKWNFLHRKSQKDQQILSTLFCKFFLSKTTVLREKLEKNWNFVVFSSWRSNQSLWLHMPVLSKWDLFDNTQIMRLDSWSRVYWRQDCDTEMRQLPSFTCVCFQLTNVGLIQLRSWFTTTYSVLSRRRTSFSTAFLCRNTLWHLKCRSLLLIRTFITLITLRWMFHIFLSKVWRIQCSFPWQGSPSVVIFYNLDMTFDLIDSLTFL